MNELIAQEIDGERHQVLDVERLIEAVRGSRAAQVLFEYRCRRGEGQVEDAQSPGRPKYAHPPRHESVLKLELQ